MDAGSYPEQPPVEVSAPDSEPRAVSPCSQRFRLPLGSALVVVAAIAPVMALYFRLAEAYPGSDYSPNVFVLALIVTGLAVGLLRKASFLQLVVQIGLTSGVILAVLELGAAVGLGYVMVCGLVTTLVVPLLVKRLLGSEAEGHPRRARLLGMCTLSMSSFLNIAALLAFGMAWEFIEELGPKFDFLITQNIPVGGFPTPAPPSHLAPGEQPKAKLVLSWPVLSAPAQHGQPAVTRRIEHTFDLEFPRIEAARLRYVQFSAPTSSAQNAAPSFGGITLEPKMDIDFDFSIQQDTSVDSAGGVGGVGTTGNPASVLQSPSFNRRAVPDNMVKRAGAGAMVDENGSRIPSIPSPAVPEVGKANSRVAVPLPPQKNPSSSRAPETPP